MAKHLKTGIVLAIGVALAYWFIARTNWSVVGEHFRRLNWLPLVVGLVLINATMLVRALRWQALLAPITPVKLRNAFAATAIGFGSIFVIGRAGEVFRPIVLSLREKLRPSATVATILIERIYDTASVVLLFSVNLLFFEPPAQAQQATESLAAIRNLGLFLTIGIVTAIIVLIILRLKAAQLLPWLEAHTTFLPLAVRRPLLNLLTSVADGLSVLTNLRLLLTTIGYSALIWTMVTVATWLTVYAFGVALPLTHVIFIMGFGLVGSLIPTPGGSAGAFHASTAKGFEFLGLEPNLAAAIAILYHLIAFGSPFFIGLYYLVRDDISLRQLREAVAEDFSEHHAEKEFAL